MIEQTTESLREYFKDVHPLVFFRSFERADTSGELFDLLDSLPKVYPIIWDEDERRWKTTRDLTQSHKFDLEGEQDVD